MFLARLKHRDPIYQIYSYFVGAFLAVAVFGFFVITFFIVFVFLFQSRVWNMDNNLFTPGVTVSNQKISADNKIFIDSAVSLTPGWLVLYQIINGQTGPVIGFAPLKSGKNINVPIKINPLRATPKLGVMMLHDYGANGLLEYPGKDEEQMKGGHPIMVVFDITGAP